MTLFSCHSVSGHLHVMTLFTKKGKRTSYHSDTHKDAWTCYEWIARSRGRSWPGCLCHNGNSFSRVQRFDYPVQEYSRALPAFRYPHSPMRLKYCMHSGH